MDTPPAIFSQSQNRRPTARAKPRTPLQERTQSQTNEDSARLGREFRQDPTEVDIFAATPFPTKPQHILLPSTVRKQRSFRDAENQLSTIFAHGQQGGVSRPTTSGQSESGMEERGRRAPVLQLKRSVSTLRDMYESQAERSRPSTAASYALGPGTGNSRLRSASSSEGIGGRNAWEQLHKVSADDMALLPTLSRSSLERLASESSFASRVEQNYPVASTPNYRTYGTSSPQAQAFSDNPARSPVEFRQSSSSGVQFTSSSSPNFVRLGRSSSIVETLNTEQSSSSPIFVKLGTSSPAYRTAASPTPSIASDGSRKRKRAGDDTDAETSFAARSRVFSSSPPYVVIAASSSEPSLKSPDGVMPSSPPQPRGDYPQFTDVSSPVFKLPGPARNPSNSSSSTGTHESLQQALTSSPMPPIQYPVIRAPAAAASTLNVPKRIPRNSLILNEGQWISRLSPVPSEWDEGRSRMSSKQSHRSEELDNELQRFDSVSPEPTDNGSQIHIVSVGDEDHQHEAADELRALPRRSHIAYRSPPLVPTRTNSLLGTQASSSASLSQSRLDSLRTSMDTRLNSMRSFAHSRQNSFMSSINRPSSSGSQATNVVVPTWARRYYSGLYHDSFQYLYPSNSASHHNSTNNSALNIPTPLHDNYNRTTSVISVNSQRRMSTVTKNSRRSWQSIRNNFRNSIMEMIPSIVIPRRDPRLEARKSHLTAGMGPLVSNPVSPEIAQTRLDPYGPAPTIRRVSDRLPAADPRAHWAGITDEQHGSMRHEASTPYHSSQQGNRESAESGSMYYDAASGQYVAQSRFTDVPHLHHDRRLNTGSSMSRGFGFPFNRKSRHQPPSVYDAGTRPSWFRTDLRDAQVTCFIIGFICPISWFVGAFLPLPQRPESFEDIEKAAYEQQANPAGDWHDMDVVARLRLERHIKGVEELKWQNARWWKRMNRWMCFVGLVVFVLIIVLAVIGTRNHW